MSSNTRASKRRKIAPQEQPEPPSTSSSLRKSKRRSEVEPPESFPNDANTTPTKSARIGNAASWKTHPSATKATPSGGKSTRTERVNEDPAESHATPQESPGPQVNGNGIRSTPRSRRKGKGRSLSRRKQTPKASTSLASRGKKPILGDGHGFGHGDAVDMDGVDSDARVDVASNGAGDVNALEAELSKDPLARNDDQIRTFHTAFNHDDHSHDPSHFDVIRNIVLSKLTSRRPTPLRHLETQRAQVQQLLSSTVTAGQGSSLLLLGSRGVGKSALVDSVITELAQDPLNVATDGSQTFHVIRLNGFIQTDDKLALREIWRQLGREMETEEEESKGRNYADTLASLLALLSHPTELAAQTIMDGQMDVDRPPTTAEGNDKMSNAVIFLMSEFDAFAARPRQTLLYNLFDIAQSRKAPVAVLGMSTRMDVAEMLEKRVNSRFSHRYIHIPPAKSFDGYLDICRSAITIAPEELTYDEQQSLIALPTGLQDSWNVGAEGLLSSDEGAALRIHLEQVYHTTRSVPTAFSLLYLPVATLHPVSHRTLSNSVCIPPPVLAPSSAKLFYISSLPSLSLALLIAAARLPLLTNSDHISFSLAYDEYRALTTKARLAASSGGAQVHGGVAGRVWGRDVARGAWEGLIDSGLVLPEDSGGAIGMGMCRVDVALEEIEPAYGKGMEKALLKWCREL